MIKFRYILTTMLALLLTTSCVETDIDQTAMPEAPKSRVALHMKSSTKSVMGVASRAGGGNNEYTIHRGYIFVFSQDGAYKGFQAITASDVTDNHSQYPEIVTEIAGYNSSSDKIVAVFNYCESTFAGEAALAGVTLAGISDCFPLDKAYLAKLQSDFASESYALGMPMFVNDFDSTSSSGVHEVYRALARIELYVRKTEISTGLVEHTHAFSPENVKFAVINAAENGEIGYASRGDIAGKDGGTPYSAGDELLFEHKPTEYEFVEEIASADGAKSAIYLYEFPFSRRVISGDGVAQNVYDADRLSIIIEHADEDAHPGEIFYYKLQLMDKSTGDYYDIKRNHDYRVVIKNVYSDGYKDVDEACMLPPSNIEYEIFDDQGDLTFSNGQYAISMDQVLNYENVTIYGPETSYLSFDNIRRILPSEVVDPLTPEEIEAMTNSVEFSIVSVDESLELTPIQNDFDTDNRLTDEGKSIKLELKGEGEAVVKLKIKLGNLVLGFDNIAITKVGSDLGGDSSFDAHPCQLNLKKTNMIPGTWSSPDSDFGARNSADSLVIYMGENATPVGYKTLNGYISTAAAENAYPYFEPKTREGYYSYYDLEADPERTVVKKAKIVLNQLAPFYIGHFGSKAEAGPHYYNAVIAEKIEEIPDTESWQKKSTGGKIHWSEGTNKIFYIREKIYGNYLGLSKYLNFSEGRNISQYIVDNNKEAGYLPTAARYCYMKNDINGDGEIGPDEPIVWYLPAVNQMMAMWVAKHLIDSQIDSKYFGFHLQEDIEPYYWTCSEIAPTDWQLTNKQFDYNVARFNMLEGELSTGGYKGTGFDSKAHVRCVRGIIYDNIH